jgi:hypothetical protein
MAGKIFSQCETVTDFADFLKEKEEWAKFQGMEFDSNIFVRVFIEELVDLPNLSSEQKVDRIKALLHARNQLY